MAEIAFLLGESGTGKTYSLRNLNPETTLIIGVTPKAFTFEHNFKYLSSKDKTGSYVVIREVQKIIDTIRWAEKNMNFNTYVIDDFTYLQSFEFFNRINQKGFDKFNEVGNVIYKLLEVLLYEVDRTKIAFLLGHLQFDNVDGVRYVKMKTIGTLVDQLLKIEGLSNNILMTDVSRVEDDVNYHIITQNDGKGIFKSSQLCNFDYKIPNDLELVRQAIDKTIIK